MYVLERYEYQDVAGSTRVDRNSDPLYGEIPSAVEDLRAGLDTISDERVDLYHRPLGATVHQDGRSTTWIRGKYGTRLRVIVEADEAGTIPRAIREERGRIATAPQLQEELAQREAMYRELLACVDKAITILGRAQEVEELNADEVARRSLDQAMEDAIDVLCTPKRKEKGNVGG